MDKYDIRAQLLQISKIEYTTCAKRLLFLTIIFKKKISYIWPITFAKRDSLFDGLNKIFSITYYCSYS